MKLDRFTIPAAFHYPGKRASDPRRHAAAMRRPLD